LCLDLLFSTKLSSSAPHLQSFKCVKLHITIFNANDYLDKKKII